MKPVSLLKAQKNLLISQEVFFVDNSIEISNYDITRKEFINTCNLISFIIEEWGVQTLISPPPIVQSCSTTSSICDLRVLWKWDKYNLCYSLPERNYILRQLIQWSTRKLRQLWIKPKIGLLVTRILQIRYKGESN